MDASLSNNFYLKFSEWGVNDLKREILGKFPLLRACRTKNSAYAIKFYESFDTITALRHAAVIGKRFTAENITTNAHSLSISDVDIVREFESGFRTFATVFGLSNAFRRRRVRYAMRPECEQLLVKIVERYFSIDLRWPEDHSWVYANEVGPWIVKMVLINSKPGVVASEFRITDKTDCVLANYLRFQNWTGISGSMDWCYDCDEEVVEISNCIEQLINNFLSGVTPILHAL